MGDFVRYELDGGIATVTMDDGKVNVLTREGFAELSSAFDRAQADGGVVVLRGRPGVFSAGFHLPSLLARDDSAVDLIITGFELAERVLSFPAPVLIACTGHALAMGAFLLLAGDLRIGTLGPYRIGTNEVAIGLVMPSFGIEMSRQRVTPAYFNRGVVNGEVFAYPTICPHLGGPLDEAPLEAGCVTCPWHGYRYDLRSGRCVSGKSLALEPLPRVVVDRDGGEVSLTW